MLSCKATRLIRKIPNTIAPPDALSASLRVCASSDEESEDPAGHFCWGPGVLAELLKMTPKTRWSSQSPVLGGCDARAPVPLPHHHAREMENNTSPPAENGGLDEDEERRRFGLGMGEAASSLIASLQSNRRGDGADNVWDTANQIFADMDHRGGGGADADHASMRAHLEELQALLSMHRKLEEKTRTTMGAKEQAERERDDALKRRRQLEVVAAIGTKT